MGMDWNISEKMVVELLEAQPLGVKTRLQAMLVFQHCTVHGLSLFDFFAAWEVDGLRLLPKAAAENAPSSFLNEMMEALGAEDAVESGGADSVLRASWQTLSLNEMMEELRTEKSREIGGADSVPPKCGYRYAAWRTLTLAADRLEMLRKHLSEVNGGQLVTVPEQQYLETLLRYEQSLAAVVERVPTLGMVADDSEDDRESDTEADPGEAAESPLSESVESLPVLTPTSAAEQSEIAAVLANPTAASAPAQSVRKDQAGRVLVTDSRLAEMYLLAERLGINRVQVQEINCHRHKLRHIEDMPDAIAVKILEKMRAQVNAA